MSPDLFPKYLKEPSLLYRISYEELKTLVVQYPYCQNLRYLLLIKSKMDGNVEQDRNMKMASAYSLDRTQLYLLLKNDLKETQKDFEFLDLNHAISDEENAELELPLLDFSKGIEIEEKSKVGKVTKLDLTQPINNKEVEPQSSENSADDLLDLFEEDIDEQEGIVQEITPPSLPEMVLPLVPPLDFSFDFKEDTKEIEIAVVVVKEIILPLIPPSIVLDFPRVIEAETPLVAINFPLVPPRVTLDIVPEPIIAQRQAPKVPQILKLPAVPPMIPLDIIPSPVLEIKEEIKVEKSSFNYPLIPPVIDINDFDQEEVETISFAQEIDDSIMAALTRLALKQKLELEEEEKEKEALLMASIKKEIQYEEPSEEIAEETEVQEEEEIEEVEEVIENEKTDDVGPMPKASFSSWLKQTKAPTPSIHPREPLIKNKKKAVDKAEKEYTSPFDKSKGSKKAKAKKKKTQIENEGSRLIKALKARQSEDRKEESKLMLIRKKKVMELAERSLRENEEIISETLAKILLIQGKKDKAMHMYRQLMLKFPKKSSFFAAEIEKIQK